MDLPSDLTEETWQDFQDYRREIKKPLTPVATRRTLAKLDRLHAEGYSAEKLIDMAITNRWQGVWTHEDCKHEISTRVSTKRPQSAVERVHAANITRINAGRIVDPNDGDLRPQVGLAVR